MAPTLASIAAPAPITAPVAAASARKENAKEKAAIDKGLAEVRVERIRVDGLALMKIIKHSREAHQVVPPPAGTSNATASFSPAVGQLLGIDSNGTLEVSNAFALPSGSLGGTAGEGETETRGLKAANKYTSQLLPRLADLNADASLVGFYTSTNNGQHLAMPGFIDALVGAQLSGGGIGSGQSKVAPVGRTNAAKAPMPSGTGTKSGKGIALVFDVASATQGHVGLRAYRLTPDFIEAYRAGKFDTASLIENKVVPTNILEEVPVVVHSSALLTAFLSTLVTPSSTSAAPSFP
ncbi:translation initiation factor 3 subunit H, partial [Phenoliferia sp. Uapishka_3]